MRFRIRPRELVFEFTDDTCAAGEREGITFRSVVMRQKDTLAAMYKFATKHRSADDPTPKEIILAAMRDFADELQDARPILDQIELEHARHTLAGLAKRGA